MLEQLPERIAAAHRAGRSATEIAHAAGLEPAVVRAAIVADRDRRLGPVAAAVFLAPPAAVVAALTGAPDPAAPARRTHTRRH